MASSYLMLHHKGILRERIEQACRMLTSCSLCPRACGIDRLSGDRGFCGAGRKASVASFAPHFGEEAPISGRSGSGTIFLSRCNLLCSFCQNYEISHLAEGAEVDAPQLAAMMLSLQTGGCHNINFVSPTHYIPQILEALPHAIEKGLTVPLVYNTGGYDSPGTIRLLDGIFDIYMPDFKFWDRQAADRFCGAPDYPEIASAALREMHRQAGVLELDEEGVARKGLLVRHLVMPNGLAGTPGIMKFIVNEISPDTFVNIMDQYRPCGKAAKDPEINRRITHAEYEEALEAARRAGIKSVSSL